MKSFNDTNVSIAYVFLFEPQNEIAKHIICKEYDEVYWSSNVVNEFQNRVVEKKDYLLSFFDKLQMELYDYSKLYYSFKQLEDFAKNFSYDDAKHENDVMMSLKPFWNYYFQHSTESVTENMTESIRDFRIFLNTIVFERMDFCEDSYVLTDDIHKRTNEYSKLYALLDSYEDVHDEDIQIALDAHDFSKTLVNPLDFITFDEIFRKAVLKYNLFFNKVKGIKDYDFLT